MFLGMASLSTDLREWVSETLRMLLKLLTAVGIGVLGSRTLTAQFPPDEAVVVGLLVCVVLFIAKLAFEVGRGYERV